LIKKKERLEAGEIKSILSQELKIEGSVETKGKVRIDGEIVGDVWGEFVIFGNSARVRGNVRGKKVVFMGSLEGNLTAEEAEVKSTAKVVGNVYAKELSIERGASISGEVKSGEFYSESSQENLNR